MYKNKSIIYENFLLIDLKKFESYAYLLAVHNKKSCPSLHYGSNLLPVSTFY